MIYRIELEKINKNESEYARPYEETIEYVHSILELKAYLKECIPSGFKVLKITKTTKDGRGYDITDKYIK